MTQTTNLGLKKIDGADNWRQIFDDHNQSMDLVDEAVTKLQEELGIVCDKNKCAIAASAGQYVILKNSSISGLENGLYTASKAIPANTVIDSTYLTAVPNGGLNALNSKITSVQHAAWTASSNPGVRNAVTNPVTFKAGKKYVVTITLPNVTPASGSDNWINMRDNNNNVIVGSYIAITWGSYKSKTFYYEPSATFDCPARSEQPDVWKAAVLEHGGLTAIEFN